MKAKEITENIYIKLVSLNYSRKENDLESVNSINWFDLDGELKSHILSFPTRHVKFDVDLMDIEDRERDLIKMRAEANREIAKARIIAIPPAILANRS